MKLPTRIPWDYFLSRATGRSEPMGLTTRLMALCVLVVAVLVFAPSLWNGFAYDDNWIIALDGRIHDLSMAPRIFVQSYWPNPDIGLYRPLASLSYAIDWAIAGDDPMWFHAVNVLWNAAACVLSFLILASLVSTPAALAGALVFAVHPVHVEAVANVVGRAEVMAGFFSFATFLIWLRGRPGQPLSRKRLCVAAGCYSLAMLSKESAIMIPVLIVLLDAARGEFGVSNWKAWLARHARTGAVLGAVAGGFLLLRGAVLGGVGPRELDLLFDVAASPGPRILTALQAWPHFLRLLVFPVTLLSDYGPPLIMPAMTITSMAAAGALILGALVLGGLLGLDRGRGQLACVLLFLPVALLPVSNLVVPIGVLIAERALYLPSFALSLAVAFGLNALPHRHLKGALAVVGIVVVLFAARSVHRIPAWDSTASIFEALRQDRPDSFRLQWYDARIAVEAEDTVVALRRYADAIQTWPYRKSVVVEAVAYGSLYGRLEFAGEVAANALELWPDDVPLIRMNAGIRLDLGDVDGARVMISRGLTIAPGDSLLDAMRAAFAQPPAQ
jgi:protein O-mannosyl-transferase